MNMVGMVYELTMTENEGVVVLKGGSWLDSNPQESCKASARNFILPRQKRMDVGFRCVKPVFCREDVDMPRSEEEGNGVFTEDY
jgi:formylglycine-generating enzyme required for sulfatase activity